MNNNERMILEKRLCYYLRHHPEEANLILDEQGFCDVNEVRGVLNISSKELETIVNLSDKHRFEIIDNKIRALYGHSTKEKIVKEEIEPPCYLYHGTTHKAYQLIKQQGLRSMSRQYVHLSFDQNTAKTVGERRDNNPIILKVNAKQAYQDGCKFYKGNDRTILADEVPAKYLEEI